MLIYLIGYMGSGKTTVGRKLARRLGYDFTDLDLMIENDYKISIPGIFQKYDENAFRKIEHETLKKTLSFENTIISTGGGTPCFFNNIEMINENGFSVYLKMSTKSLYDRLINSKKKRPLLTNKSQVNILNFIEDQLTIRETYYQKSLVEVKGENLDLDNLVNIVKNFGDKDYRKSEE
ncbi:MAG: hypothetical protein B6D61_10215 [Bacteroidetes bacterium 4484_249]|nr:MAG: hypothetical protein B6D61_10215 [Bacteroidetes bacterium 4484_249]